jgi:hypothetical protein
VGKLYTSELVSINGTGYTVEIWDNATTPTVKTLLLTGEGFTISHDGEGDKTFENPVRHSRAEATFSITETADITIFQNMAVSDEGSYHMVIKKGAQLIWAGRILPDQNQWQRTPDGVFTMTVTAVDALQLLENYEIDENWFDADGRILISKFIYELLNVVGMADIWDDAGGTNTFFADALRIYETTLLSFTDERISKQKISINAFWKDFNTYTNYGIRTNAYAGFLVNCKEALEKILINFNARIILSNGVFWLYNPLGYANYTAVYYNTYNTSGNLTATNSTFNHALPISTTNTVRPKWREFPVITHQPSEREIKITHQKYASKTNVRFFNAAGTGTMTVGPFRTNDTSEIISEATIQIDVPNQSLYAQYDNVGVRLKARTYSFDGTNYKTFDHEDKEWKSAAGKPGWTEKTMNLPLYYSRGIARQFYPYNYQYNYSYGADYVYTEFEIEMLLLKLGSPTRTQPINFSGIQRLYQNTELPTEQLFTNSNNTTASNKNQYDVVFYDQYGLDAHGTILVDNNAGSYVPSDAWSAFPTGTHTYVNDLISVNGYSSMALYTNAVKSISGDWYDGGSYNLMRSLNFDESIWIWQGGTFNAQSEVFSGEWLRVASSFGLVVVGSEEDEQEGFDNDQFSQGLVALNDRVNLLYEQDLNLSEFFQYNVLFSTDFDQAITPAQDTIYNVGIKYNTSNEELSWVVQELGRVQSLTGGTHDLDPTCELIICDATAENVIINLPDPATVKGLKYHFKKISSSHQVQLNGTIDGLGLYSFNGKDDCKVLMSDGTAYWLVAYYHK